MVQMKGDSSGYYLPRRRGKERVGGTMLRTTSVADFETASSLPRLSMVSRRARSESMTPDWKREEGVNRRSV